MDIVAIVLVLLSLIASPTAGTFSKHMSEDAEYDTASIKSAAIQCTALLTEASAKSGLYTQEKPTKR